MKNIAEILKDCPKGTKLYSLVHGEVELTSIVNEYIHCKPSYLNHELSFNSDGRWVKNQGECILFPSKENRDWDKFRPFKDGDVLATNSGAFIGIVKIENNKQQYAYVAINMINNLGVNMPYGFERFATEEEKQKLFKAINDNGYKWNAETKTLEKLIEPKFKVGDRIKQIGSPRIYIIKAIEYDRYILHNNQYIKFKDEKIYELAKFDISTLKPFDKVLVRDYDYHHWRCALYERYDNTRDIMYFATIIGHYQQCIPFEGNEHLVGTTNDCDEYYKTWK